MYSLTWDKKQQERLGNEVVSSLGLALTPASHPQQLYAMESHESHAFNV